MSVQSQRLQNWPQSLGRLLLQRLYDALTFLPLLVVALWMIWIIDAVIEVGHWPTQYNPVSSQTALGPILEPVCSYLTFGVLVSWPLWIVLTLSTHLRFIPLRFEWRRVWFYTAAIVLFLLIGDKGGIIAWMWD